jgi:DNA-binding transcriptional regulator YiaG
MAKAAAKKRKVIPDAPKRPRGKPPHVKDAKIASIVELCKAIGYSQEQTALVATVSVETLQKYYADEWEKGGARVNAKIAGNLATIAANPSHPKSVTAAIFWMKARMGWSDMKIAVKAGDNETVLEGDEDMPPISFTIKIGDRGAEK